jgi:predicted nucleotidyltransferase
MKPLTETPALHPADRALLVRARDAVHAVEPGAAVILYGSRARGDATADSDWDLLVLVEGRVDRDRERRIHDRLYDLELETEAVLVALVHSRDDWNSPLYRAMPLHANVEREGIVL